MSTSKPTQPFPRDVSFIAPEELKAHLGLLNAFSSLRQKVQDSDASDFPACVAKERDRRWAWFVGLAVERSVSAVYLDRMLKKYRFELWCKTLAYNQVRSPETFLSRLMPPLDVFMVWHSYLLNPACYQEDVQRVDSVRILEDFHPFLEESLPAISQGLSHPASRERVQYWEDITECPFDPFRSMKSYLKHRRIICPKCSADLIVPLTNNDGSGYLQENFFTDCTLPCGQRITKEELGARKLIRDIVQNNKGTDESHFAAYIAGSLFSPNTLFDYKRAKAFKTLILSSPKFMLSEDVLDSTEPIDKKAEMAMVREVGLSLATMKQYFHDAIGGSRPLPRIFDAYVDDKPWSLDLVGAVLRQASFVQKMVDLKWTAFSPTTGPEEDDILLHAIVRYHRFMELLASSPESFFVPTLDIDLAWHTHQLMPSKYKKDYLAYVGRFVDHDDKVETNKLSTSFDDTSRAWKKRFGQCYTHCGCPKPGDTMGMKLHHVLDLGGSSNDAALTPPNDTDKVLDGTHRSDHPAVYARNALDEAEKQRLVRVAKYEKRVRKEDSGEKVCPFGYEDLNQSVPRLYDDATRSTPSDCVGSHPGFVHDFGDDTTNDLPGPPSGKERRSRGTRVSNTSTYVDYGGFSFGGWNLTNGGIAGGSSCGGGSSSSNCGGATSSSCGGGSGGGGSGGCGGGGG
ncbi:hypothetical protein V5O48_017528 [Marasmius crinis-equi]|uniref:Uncharacterized protein n=1 Tax=Marasmius crinis-equi TaxID=585013 RepID=A0ABR3ENS1_9AGAR